MEVRGPRGGLVFEDDWVWLTQGARGREIYIGRGSLKRGVPRSKWANPFVIGVDGNRPGVVNISATMLGRPSRRKTWRTSEESAWYVIAANTKLAMETYSQIWPVISRRPRRASSWRTGCR